MKKLNYEMAKNLLTRSELRRITGGSGGRTKECGDWCDSNSDCSPNESCPSCKEGKDPLDPDKKADVCQ